MKTKPGPGKAVVLLSGGLDSATALAIARAEQHMVYALTVDYHQRHARELASARVLASSLEVEKHLMVDFNMRDIGGSALTADLQVPKTGFGDSVLSAGRRPSQPKPTNQGRIPITYVPARNTIFLSFGLAWAEVLGAEAIFIGANALDYSGYPDCRPEYLRAFETMANLATKASVEGGMRFRIEAPLITMTKAEIIRRGTELGLDYGLTWSCYDPQQVTGARGRRQGTTGGTAVSPDPAVQPCGRCDSCILREKGFREAGIRDPLL